ncbi:hypothetical protein Rhe02_90430 [Rhizocola hellebori]|uniref:Lipoprotein n=1 Tax=Rhizocola hellebori TaxID=1392758 RepID=A0A8J3VM96_9ACTN|nr:hypothetical protein [Rhizocola hellebori]GIH10976.1 hypothetical protein Rhe02_90430 [Rhizocola hellebori]
MPQNHSRLLSIAATLALTGVLTACAQETPTATPTLATQVSTSPSPAKAALDVPTCPELRNAAVRGLIDPYYAFGDEGAPLTEGMYSDKDGLVLALQQPCASGDLGSDIGAVTVGAIMNSVTGTTGRFWNVMLCTKATPRAKCMVHIAMNDRDPIESISFTGNKMTLVYLTRPDAAGSAVASVRRTAIYAAEGTVLKEQSHTDVPYTP